MMACGCHWYWKRLRAAPPQQRDAVFDLSKSAVASLDDFLDRLNGFDANKFLIEAAVEIGKLVRIESQLV